MQELKALNADTSSLSLQEGQTIRYVNLCLASQHFPASAHLIHSQLYALGFKGMCVEHENLGVVLARVCCNRCGIRWALSLHTRCPALDHPAST